MSLDPRADALLSKYPDHLSDEELDELRSLAKEDSLVEAMMDSIHEAEAMLLGDGDELEMSEAGRELLDTIVSETLDENPDIDLTVEELFAPVPPGADVSKTVELTPSDGPSLDSPGEPARVVPLTKEERRRGPSPLLAVAAALLLGPPQAEEWGCLAPALAPMP